MHACVLSVMQSHGHALSCTDAAPSFLCALCWFQVSQAFNIVYSSGLNVYALYLDCAGGVGSQRPFHHAMRHHFRAYRKHWQTNQVGGTAVPACADELCRNAQESLKKSWCRGKSSPRMNLPLAPLAAGRRGCLGGGGGRRGAPLHQQHGSN